MKTENDEVVTVATDVLWMFKAPSLRNINLQFF